MLRLPRSLDEIDPLPALGSVCSESPNPSLDRLIAEQDGWKPYQSRPDWYINGKGQLKYAPPEPEDVIEVQWSPALAEAFRVKLEAGKAYWDKLAAPEPPAEFALSPKAAAEFSEELKQAQDYYAARTKGRNVQVIDGKEYECDADGWIAHTPGDPMPCEPGLFVIVDTRDAGISKPHACGTYWDLVTRWKPV